MQTGHALPKAPVEEGAILAAPAQGACPIPPEPAGKVSPSRAAGGAAAGFLSGISIVDEYLEDGYEKVSGMSSRFAAAIVARLLAIQTKAGIGGGFAEIGTFKGRFFIAMAKALRPQEIAVGIDNFEWPNPAVLETFEHNCDAYGLERPARRTLKCDSCKLTAPELLKTAGGPLRLIHIDGGHTTSQLRSDLSLGFGTLAPRGLMVIDDMLHPAYPTLDLAVHSFLTSRPGLRVVAVIDRQDIIGACKFVIGAAGDQAFYESALCAAFPNFVWQMRAQFANHDSLVLTPSPWVPVVN